MGVLLAAALAFGGVTMPAAWGTDLQTVQAAQTTIQSMNYYSSNDGPVISAAGVGEASFGFVMPIFNGGSATWEDVSGDLSVRVKVNGAYQDIDSVGSFIYNQNWGHWNDGGFTGYWFKVSQTTDLQLYSKSTGVSLDYTLQFQNINKTTITSMTPTDGPVLTAGPTGSVGFTYPTFNGDSSIPYDAVAEDLRFYVKSVNSSEWVSIDNNAASGWIYDNNWGQFTDGPGGLWFTLTESINVKLESVSSGANVVYTLNYEKIVRNSNNISAYDANTTYTADNSGAIGLPLPKIDGNPAQKDDLEKFVYEIKINGQWVEMGDYSQSTFMYAASGYNKMSDKNQWGYWVDYIYGLWFQPIQENFEFRIGFPENGNKGGAINNNYVYYTFIGNPSAPRPKMPEDDFVIGDPNSTALDGWELVFDDEFSGNSLDTGTWNYVTGYYINDDPGTWGWGNNELEHYTDSERNVYVQNGVLNLTAYNEPKSFPQDPNRYAQYSSGKITTENKFSFKYGRIDFRAKLPSGNGLWPALWLLPNDDTYGTWAASGEIDVMEARGRVPGATSGAIHFGGTWPANTYMDGAYSFSNGERFDTDFHTYSLVWEEDMLKWYVDGELFFFANSDQWYSTASNSKRAPFDKEFYIIMNLAVGGWFDNGVVPGEGDIPATMQVDYVRVYKEVGNSAFTSTGSTGAGGNTGNNSGNTNTGSNSGNTDNNNNGNNGDNNNTGSGRGVTLYTDGNYQGKGVTFGVGEYNMAEMRNAGIENDTVSSIKVPLGYKLTAFWDIDFGGKTQVYSADAAEIGEWNDQITSFIVEEAVYYIYNQNSGLVLDVEGNNKNDGANLIQYNLNRGNNQQWKVTEVEDGYVAITSVLNSKVIDVAGGSRTNGGNVLLWSYNRGDNQKWQIRNAGGGYCYIVNKNSGLSLDADGWSKTPGGNIIQWQLGDRQANQLWKFELANADAAKP